MWGQIAGTLMIVLCLAAASGTPEAANEPISKIDGNWRLAKINDGLAAVLVARSADGTDVQLSISCRPDEPKKDCCSPISMTPLPTTPRL
jgi:hypothetical protein